MRLLRGFLPLFLVTLTLSVSASTLSASDLLALGRVDDAITTLRAKINSSPDDAQAYNLLCRSYFELHAWNDGIPACEKAVALQNDESLYHLWLGRIYGEKADSSNFLTAANLAGKVRDELQKAVQLNPDSADARTDLAEFYLEAPGIIGGGRDKAEAQAQALAKLAPDRAHWVYARIAEKNKDFATAEKEYRAAIEASHGSAHDWFNLALFYSHQKDYDAMQRTLVHTMSLPIDQPEVRMESAELLIRAGRDFPDAIQWLHQYLSGPTVEAAPAFKAHYLLGTVLEKQGEQQQAAQEYEAALSLAKNYSPAAAALKHLDR
jgi:tetratricopeptide (TPR) repeat protein